MDDLRPAGIALATARPSGVSPMCPERTHCCDMTSVEPMAALPAVRIVTIAREWIGVPFRPQGRDRHGVDCVGLLAAVWNEAGRAIQLPADYSLARTPCSRVSVGLLERGFEWLPRTAATAGDLLLKEPAPHRAHLALLAGHTVIEADIRAGRVIERRLLPDEAWLCAWRYSKWDE